ncbi:MAG: tetratricopeptide repeat protein [Solirubrobacteraceae bacterium]
MLLPLGQVVAQSGDPLAARAAYSEAIDLFTRLGDTRNAGVARGNLGYAELQQGNAAAARGHCEASLEIARKLHDTHNIVATLQNLGAIALLERDLEQALTNYLAALKLARRADYKNHVAHLTLILAVCSSAHGDHARAALLHGAGDHQFEALGAVVEPVEAQLSEQNRAELRTILGEAAYQAAYENGRALSTEEALNLIDAAFSSGG